MADYKGLNITWRADSSPATRALNQLSAEAKAAHANLSAIDRALNACGDASGDLATQLKSLQLQEMGNAARAAGEKVKAYQQLIEELNKSLESQRQKYVANQEALESYDPYEKLAESATESMKRVEEAQQALAEATQRVEFSGNTQDWVQALNDQADAQRNLNAVMAEGDAAFERAGEQSERYVNSLKGAMNSARENIVHLGEEIGSTTQKMKVQEAEAAQLGQQYDSLQADMDAMVTKSLAADSAMGQFGSKLQDFGSGMSDAGGAVKDFGDKMSVLGDKMTLIKGFALTQFAKTMITDTEEFGNSIAQLGGYLDIAGAQLDAMSDQALKWGKDTQFSANEAAQAMNELAKGGMTQAQISGGAMEATMQLAAAGELDMASAAETAVQAIKTFGLEAADSGMIADALAGAANKSTAEVTDLAAGFKYAGAQASLAGWDINEVTGALALMADHGLRGEMAGTALANVMKRLATPTDTAREVMEQYGIEVRNADGTMKGAVEVVQELQDKLGGLNDAAKSEALNDIFQTRGLVGAVALLDEGTDKFQEYIAATEQAGYATEMAQSRMGDLGWALEYLRGEVETAIVNFGDALAPTIIEVAHGIEGLLSWFNSLSDGTQQFIAKSTLLVTAIGPLLSLFGGIASGVGGFVSAIGEGASTIATFTQLMQQSSGTATTAADCMHNLAEAYVLASGETEKIVEKTAAAEAAMSNLATGGVMLLGAALVGSLVSSLIEYVEHVDMVREATTGLDEAMRNAEQSMESWSTNSGAINSFAALADAAKSTNDTLKEVADFAGKVGDSFSSIGQSSHELEEYGKAIEELAGKSDLTKGELQLLKDAVEKYNDVAGTSIKVIDDTTGALNLQPDAIRRVTDAYLDQVKAQTYVDLWSDAIKEQAKVEQELAEATAEYTAIQEKYSLKLGDSGWEISALIGGALDDYRRLAENKEGLEKSNESLLRSIDHWRDMIEETGGSVSEYNELLEELGITSQDTGDDVNDLEGDVEDLAETTTEATEEMKRAIADAIETRKRALEDAYTQRKRELDEDMSNLKAANKQAEEEEKAHWDEQKRILKEGLDDDAEELEESLKEAYDLRKDELKKQRDLLKDSLDDELSTLKDSLNEAYELRKSELDREYSQLKDQLSKQLSAEKDALAEDVSNLKAAQKERLQSVKDSMAEEVSARKDALKQQVADQKAAFAEVIAVMKAEHTAAETELKKQLDAQYKERQKAASKEYKQWQKDNQRQLKEYKAQQQAEVKAFKDATNQRIAAIKAEYEARKKYLEEHDGTKEIDERIAALNAEEKAEDEAKCQRERAERTAELRLAVERAKTRRTRKDAEDALSDYLNQLAEEDRKAERQRLIDSLEEQRDQIADETKLAQAGLDEQRDAEIASYQQRREAELEQLQARQAEQYDALSEQLAGELELRKEKQDEQLAAYKETLDKQLEALKASNEAAREERAAEQEAILKQMEADNAAEIAVMQKQSEAVIKQMEADNANVIKQLEANNAAYLEQLDANNKERLQAVHDQNEAELKDIKQRNADEVDDKANSNAAILADQEDHDSKILKELQKANSDQLDDVKNRNAEEVRDFETSTGKIVDSLKARNTAAETELKYYNDNILTDLKRKNDDALTNFKRDLEDGKLTVDTRTGEVKEAVGKAKQSVTKDVGDTGEKAKTTAGQASKYVTDKVLEAKEKVLGASGKVKTDTKNDNDATEKSFTNAWSNISTAAKNGSDKVYTSVTDKVGKLPEWAEKTGPRIPQGLANGMGNGTTELSTKVDNVSEKIKEIDHSGESEGWGFDLIDNLTSGIWNGTGPLTNALISVANTISGYIGHSVPKDGPLHEGGRGEIVWGEDLVDNLKRGIENGMPEFESSIARLSELAAQTFDADALQESADVYMDTYRETLRQIEDDAKRHATVMESYGLWNAGGEPVASVGAGAFESYRASMAEMMDLTQQMMERQMVYVRQTVNEALRSGVPSAGVTVMVNEMHVTDRSDINRVADALYHKIHTYESMSLRR